jgi:hypothetical protein
VPSSSFDVLDLVGGRDCATSGLAPSATGFVAIFIASIMAWAAAASGTDQRIAGDYLHARQVGTERYDLPHADQHMRRHWPKWRGDPPQNFSGTQFVPTPAAAPTLESSSPAAAPSPFPPGAGLFLRHSTSCPAAPASSTTPAAAAARRHRDQHHSLERAACRSDDYLRRRLGNRQRPREYIPQPVIMRIAKS